MTATIEEIHRDPAILDRAILQQERLEIVQGGRVAAEVVPCLPREAGWAGKGTSLPVFQGGKGLRPGVDLEDREQMWDLAGGL